MPIFLVGLKFFRDLWLNGDGCVEFRFAGSIRMT